MTRRKQNKAKQPPVSGGCFCLRGEEAGGRRSSRLLFRAESDMMVPTKTRNGGDGE